MGLEQWWNDTDGGKPKYWEINLSQCHFVHQKYHMDRQGIETGLTNIRKVYKNYGCCIQREEPVFFIDTNRLIFVE